MNYNYYRTVHLSPRKYLQNKLTLAGRILTNKENFPSCTLIVILFLEQGLEIRALQQRYAQI